MSLPPCSCLFQVEALLARDSHNAKQIEVLKAEVNRLRGGNRTETLAALHDEALQEVGCLNTAARAATVSGASMRVS